MTSIYQDNLQSRCPDLFNLAEYVLENANKNPTKKRKYKNQKILMKYLIQQIKL